MFRSRIIFCSADISKTAKSTIPVLASFGDSYNTYARHSVGIYALNIFREAYLSEFKWQDSADLMNVDRVNEKERLMLVKPKGGPLEMNYAKLISGVLYSSLKYPEREFFLIHPEIRLPVGKYEYHEEVPEIKFAGNPGLHRVCLDNETTKFKRFAIGIGPESVRKDFWLKPRKDLRNFGGPMRSLFLRNQFGDEELQILKKDVFPKLVVEFQKICFPTEQDLIEKEAKERQKEIDNQQQQQQEEDKTNEKDEKEKITQQEKKEAIAKKELENKKKRLSLGYRDIFKGTSKQQRKKLASASMYFKKEEEEEEEQLLKENDVTPENIDQKLLDIVNTMEKEEQLNNPNFKFNTEHPENDPSVLQLKKEIDQDQELHGVISPTLKKLFKEHLNSLSSSEKKKMLDQQGLDLNVSLKEFSKHQKMTQ